MEKMVSPHPLQAIVRRRRWNVIPNDRPQDSFSRYSVILRIVLPFSIKLVVTLKITGYASLVFDTANSNTFSYSPLRIVRD